jgi:DNA-binding SARP family transcriptional activator
LAKTVVGKRPGSSDRLEVGVLGELRVTRGRERIELPQSKKARALLGYLALTGREHRRDKLSGLLWDVADDPRGALRWTLSRLRQALDGPAGPAIAADRDVVAIAPAAATVDFVAIRRSLDAGADRAERPILEQAAAAFRGELLEGLDLPDFYTYSAWLAAQREEARRLHSAVLAALSSRLAERPEEALPHARQRAEIDPLDEDAQVGLVTLLVRARRTAEAEQQCEAAQKLFQSLGVKRPEVLMAMRAAMLSDSRLDGRHLKGAPAVERAPVASPPPELPVGSLDRSTPFDLDSAHPLALVGRRGEMGALVAAQQRVLHVGRAAVVLVTGEPGIGKSRLLEELERVARARSASIFRGSAHEAGMGLPFGPWMEALHDLPPRDLEPSLLRGLGPLLAVPSETEGPAPDRDSLYRAVARLVETKAHTSAPVMLLLDDIQWLDEASAALLHHVLQTGRNQPLLCVLAARTGELGDNRAMLALLRGLRRARALHEIELSPLTAEEVREIAQAARATVDVDRIVVDSGGNPLFALELSRFTPRPGAGLPDTLADLVVDRVERLMPGAREVVLWAAVLGTSCDANDLAALSGLATEPLIVALESLERHALLRVHAEDGAEPRYAFSHDLLQRAVYSRLSEPRRRLMHRRIAEVLESFIDDPQGRRTADLARHAALGGDPGLAARACLQAARRCLRLFSAAEARAFTERGLMYAASLEEPRRVPLEIHLRQVLAMVGGKRDADDSVATLLTLAERAIDCGDTDAARTGFLAVAFLRWEGGGWEEAERASNRIGSMGRAGDEPSHIRGLGEAGHCLALLERDLPRAEAMLLEAKALGQRHDVSVSAIASGLGVIHRHRGEGALAAALLEQARAEARVDGNHWSEFVALAQLVEVDLECGALVRGESRATELVALAEKMPDGSELPYARALTALVARAQGRESASELEQAADGLRASDANQRLAAVLSYACELELDRGTPERALAQAKEALGLARNLERKSDVVSALSLIVRAAAALGDEAAFDSALMELRRCPTAGLSRRALTLRARALEEGRARGAEP